MKKYGICVLGMLCLLGVTGCSGTQENQEKDVRETQEKDVQENQDQEKDAQETRDTGEKNEENNNSIADRQENSETPDTAAVNSETAVYSQDGIYMSVDIPNGWDCRIRTKEDMEKEDGLTSCAIDFWPEDYPETVFELGYAEQFGICGTGVTIEEFTLKNGLSGYRYTEEIEDTLWLTVTLNNPDNDAAIKNGTYLISASPELSVWENIKTEFDKILESVWVGSLPNGQTAAEKPASGQGTDTDVSQYIELEEAKSIALADAKLESAKVTFIKEKLDYDDGIAEYDIEFVTDTTRYEYEINAKNGSILESSQEGIGQIGSIQGHAGITLEEAKRIALDHVLEYTNVGADEVTLTKAEADHDDGVIEYEVEFYIGGKEYSYSIDAVSGEISEIQVEGNQED